MPNPDFVSDRLKTLLTTLSFEKNLYVFETYNREAKAPVFGKKKLTRKAPY